MHPQLGLLLTCFTELSREGRAGRRQDELARAKANSREADRGVATTADGAPETQGFPFNFFFSGRFHHREVFDVNIY